MIGHRKDVRQFRNQLKQEGFKVQLTGSDHWEVRSQHGERITTFAQTPSDRRWRHNAMTAIRRWKRAQGIPA